MGRSLNLYVLGDRQNSEPIWPFNVNYAKLG